ncbi:hypothetical protein [Xanthobacter sp. KR7-225]|uniref:hypothetical protein n=1 Tax=Xanthobacter sp. KR7-225 TaxID=3156613 RepID=UPI0032B3DF75
MSAELSLTERKPPRATSPLAWGAATLAAIALWFVVYAQLAPFSQWLVARLPVEPGAGHSARLHDGGDRLVAAGNDHPAQSPEPEADRRVHRRGGHRHLAVGFLFNALFS